MVILLANVNRFCWVMGKQRQSHFETQHSKLILNAWIIEERRCHSKKYRPQSVDNKAALMCFPSRNSPNRPRRTRYFKIQEHLKNYHFINLYVINCEAFMDIGKF